MRRYNSMAGVGFEPTTFPNRQISAPTIVGHIQGGLALVPGGKHPNSSRKSYRNRQQIVSGFQSSTWANVSGEVAS